jgi:N-acetylmuramic acid 6-phosphate etherase
LSGFLARLGGVWIASSNRRKRITPKPEKGKRRTVVDLDKLGTERRNEATFGLDTMSVEQAVNLMNAEDHRVADAVQLQLPEIQAVIEQAIAHFKKGGRLIYLGAGTSGRLGVLDAAECVPTFGVTPDKVVGLIAGGMKAMTVAVEGAEDDAALGRQDLIDLNLTPNDMVVGIAASGRTPYVIGALDYAREIGAGTGTISCNKDAEISKHADYPIEVDCGPEFLTGSTRLKSGTAQKLVLNMISTISMIGIGKVYNNLMVDVKPTNEKLVARAKRIIVEATGCSAEQAAAAFEGSNHDVKVAIVMVLADTDAAGAKDRLAKADGFVRDAIK